MSTKIENVVYRASWRNEFSANFESMSFFNSHSRFHSSYERGCQAKTLLPSAR